MKNKKLIAYSIMAICYAELLSHSKVWNQNNAMWVHEEEHTLSVIQNGPEYKYIRTDEVMQYLLDWITEWLNESKMVILYTCPDNGEIKLHRPNDFTEDLGQLDDSPLSELTGILYMAHD